MRQRSKYAQRGIALIIVLGFIVLLTVLVVAYFTWVSSSRKLANSSSNQNNAEQLARSALDVVIADLKQEIVNGSTARTTPAGTVYVPTDNAKAVPMRSGNPPVGGDGEDPIPNLIRRSVRTDSISLPGVASRASAVNSTTDSSKNGRRIGLNRWNRHYLIPRATMGDTSVDPTPVTSFTPPDWVFVTDQGPQVLTTPVKSVIGRYAYAIYDEGGLLDLNVAGYPSSTKAESIGRKGPLAFADLTKTGLTQPQIDNIVGWRNYASARPSQSTFGSFQFDANAATNYFNYVTGRTDGFLTVSNQPLNGRTDQVFLSRQALLAFRDTLGLPQDSLQYLGTFSRDLEQPSFVPNPKRPKVRAAWNDNIKTFGTGNDAFEHDRESDPAQDINPPFLQVTTTATDTSKVPTARRRFPLSRLALLLRTATATKSDTDPIYRAFGLYRSNADQPWNYDHGNAAGIQRLSAVSQREPDFFEMLKASIQAGSLGKGAFYENAATGSVTFTAFFKSPVKNLPNAAEVQQLRDTTVDLQLLQIGANLIDQSDADSFPTRIAFAGDTTQEVRGIEDLPYLYRMHTRPVHATELTGKMFLQPELWNPHASNVPKSADAPTQFRVRLDPLVYAGKLQALYQSGPSLTTNATLTSTGLLFTASDVSSAASFREPTLLAEVDKPTGTSLQSEDFSIGGAVEYVSPGVTGRSLVGLLVGSFVWKNNGSNITALRIGWPVGAAIPDTRLRFILEYLDQSTWVTYDQQDFDLYYFTDSINAADSRNWNSSYVWMSGTRTDPRTSRWGMINGDEAAYIQPIVATEPYVRKTERPTAGKSFATHLAHIEDNAIPGGNGDGALNTAKFIGDGVPYRGFARGYFTENNPHAPAPASAGGTAVYMRDADGIARRAMGGYATETASGGAANSPAGLPMVTANNDSRPMILNRPFRSVAEMGGTFSDSIWKNLDFAFPESGNAALLDTFCLNEIDNLSGLVAGRVNLNTRQKPVLQALLSGVFKNDVTAEKLTDTQIQDLAKQLVTRTLSTDSKMGPLTNRAELVGRYTGTGLDDADPDLHYSGFAAETGAVASWKSESDARIQRMREAVPRALVDAGTARVWNLFIDVVAQSGRFAPTGTDLQKDFLVEGERRCWLHIAIDRCTGQVLDRQLETVIE